MSRQRSIVKTLNFCQKQVGIRVGKIAHYSSLTVTERWGYFGFFTLILSQLAYTLHTGNSGDYYF